MTEFDWETLLSEWDSVSMAYLESCLPFPSPEEARELPHDPDPIGLWREAIKKQTILSKGVSEGELLKKEKALGSRLPDSYRQFLKASNGIILIRPSEDTDEGLLLPLQEIGFCEVDSGFGSSLLLLSDWLQRAVQVSPHISKESPRYFCVSDDEVPNFLDISETTPTYLLLKGNAEWEAWECDSIGRLVYPSFYDLMLAEFKRIRPRLRPKTKKRPKWPDILNQWEREAIDTLRNSPNDSRGPLERDALKTGCLSFPSATDSALEEAEGRLSIKLPPSYKKFLKRTNGWRQIGLGTESGRILPVEEIGFYREKEPQNYRILEEVNFEAKGKHKIQNPEKLIMISDDVQDAVYLLNPLKKNKAGEMETWIYQYDEAPRVYSSFKALMESEYFGGPNSRYTDGIVAFVSDSVN